MTSLKFHFAKILEVEPAPISCMALNHGTNKLALFRGGSLGAIEIWDVKNQPFLEREILDLEPIEGKPSVESIVWVHDRLFSCGLHGFVVEHDVRSGRMMHKSAATSGSVWCLAVNPDLSILAAGTEDGFVNLFEIQEDCLSYIKVLDRQQGRVLCLQWSPCGKYIATGSVDSVRLWDVSKGHAVQRLITGRSKNKETIVWSLLVLEDLTIVTGDSRGIVSFWDGRVGVLKFKMQTHKADVLTLRLSEDKLSIYAAGVDPVILNIAKVSGSDNKWMKSHPRNIHVNDVLTLETQGNRLFSGGIDTDLGLSSFPPKVVVKYPNIPKASQISASKNSSMVLIQGTKSLTLWRLPSEEQAEPTSLLHLTSKGGERIFSSSLNPSGNTFGYTTLSSVKLFHLSDSSTQQKPTLQKLSFDCALDPSDSHTFIKFLTDTTAVILTSSGRSISLLKVDAKKSQSVFILNTHESDIDDDDDESTANCGVGLIATTPSLLCLTLGNQILLYSISDSTISKTCSLPTHDSLPSSISLHPSKPLILVTYVDNTVLVFNHKQGRIVFQQTLKQSNELQPFQGSVWSDDCAVMYQNDSLTLLEMVESSSTEPKRRRNNAKDDDDSSHFQIRHCDTQNKYLCFAGAYGKGEFVLVEVDPNRILEHLPPAFAKKRFGT